MATQAPAPHVAEHRPISGDGRGDRPISKVPYLPGLDGMRALAVVAVMVYHANSAWLPGGFLGVEVFFVISGYLITLLLVAERERHGQVDLKQFWLRRARRLLPALYTMMFLLVVYTAIFKSEALGQLRGDVVAGLFYVSNWYQIWVGQGYTATGDFAPLRHLWSLAVEEQFYILWPLLMAALLKRGPRRVTEAAKWFLLAAVLLTLLMAAVYPPGTIGECDVTPEAYWVIGERCISKIDTLYLSTITRAGGLLLGAAFALVWRPAAIMRSPMRTKGPALDLIALLGLVALAAMTWWLHLITPEGADPFLFRGGFFVCGLATLMMIAAATHRKAVTGPLLGNPLFLWIGTRSYGLYLYHWPIFQIIREVAGNALTFNEFVFAMALTCLVTEASFRFIETPIRKGTVGAWWRRVRRSRNPQPRRLVLGGAAVAIVLGLFGTVSLATAQLEQNEIAQALDEGEGSTTDLDEILGTTVPPTTPSGSAPSATQPVTSAGGSVAPPASAPPSTAAPTTTTTLPPQPIERFAIGDSVMLGAAPALSQGGIVVNAETSRQMKDVVPAVQALRDQGLLGNVVVVHLGTNGPFSQETLDALLEPLAGVPNVVVLTIRAAREWTAGNNEKIRALQGTRGNVIVLDWEGLSNQCPGNCFYDDDIHLRPDGQKYYSQLIFDVLGIG